MARIASKKKVNNGLGLLNVIDGVDEKKVRSVTDFGSFFVVLLKDEAIYHTHIGYEVRCKRWVMDIDNERRTASLYDWLENLVAMKNGIKGHEDELFPETDKTNEEMLEFTTVVTVANMIYPISAFTDMDTATKLACERLDFLKAQSEKLDEIANRETEDETEDDLAKNFEHGRNAILAEETAGILASQQGDNKAKA